MIMVKANKDTEAGKLPEEALIAAMAEYHEELVKAGALLDGSPADVEGRADQVLRRQANGH